MIAWTLGMEPFANWLLQCVVASATVVEPLLIRLISLQPLSQLPC